MALADRVCSHREVFRDCAHTRRATCSYTSDKRTSSFSLFVSGYTCCYTSWRPSLAAAHESRIIHAVSLTELSLFGRSYAICCSRCTPCISDHTPTPSLLRAFRWRPGRLGSTTTCEHELKSRNMLVRLCTLYGQFFGARISRTTTTADADFVFVL